MADQERRPLIGKKKLGCLLIVLSVVLICVGLVFVVYGSLEYKKDNKDKSKITDRIGVVVDAGGSGTRLYVYSYKNNSISQLKYIKCETRGLQKYSEQELPALKEKLTKCFDEGASQLPQDKKVPIYVAATAGMRLLKLRNAKAYEKIWTLVRQCVHASEFKLAKADTISGFQEAKWVWVAANYLKQTLKSHETIGTMDFGSSSLQLTFQQKQNANKTSNIRTIVIDGDKKTIYGHSYLCYGQVEMKRRFMAKLVKEANYTSIVTNPCLRTGYNESLTSAYLWAPPCSSGDYAKNYLGEEIMGPPGKTYTMVGSGNFENCYKDMKLLLDRKCTKGTCGMNNVFQTPVHGNFFALSAFYYLAKGIGLPSRSGEKKYVDVLKQNCGSKWGPSATDKYAAVRCFQGVYGYYVLTDGFKFDNATWKLEFVGKIDGEDVKWSLGLIYMKKDSMYARITTQLTQIITPGILALLVVGVFILLIGIFVAIVSWKRRMEERITV